MSADLSCIITALSFAAHKHRDQRRSDLEASPYINHPIALAQILTDVGITDAATLSAAILHDVIEDTETTIDELRAAFGDEICDLVMEVTDDKNLPKDVRKSLQIEHAHLSSDKAKLVKLADKIANLRDQATCPPAKWPLERRQAYFDWAKQVVDRIRGTHAALEALFDAAYTKKPA
jgi:guanosine-3',5'-bis(diphosphate) 3'-pyrophosphohydrolase